MKCEKLVILLVFLLVVSAAVGLSELRRLTSKAPAASPPPLRPSAAREFRGICLQIHNGDPQHPYEKYIEEIAQTGANTLCLIVTGWQENCASTSIFIDLRKTPPDARVKGLIAHARKQGLRVIFMPIVLLENPNSGEWRGKIKPEKWDDWWEDYTNYVLHYARLAQAAGAEVFIVGSELIKTEDQTDRWRALIRKVREVFKGRLSYSANWDHYRPVQWWDDLDLIGMTTYYDLTGGDKPTVERLCKSWKEIKSKILKWQAQINRPILFTEVGWPSQETCAQYPWDYYRSKKADPTAQANCFEAFFRTWIQEDSAAGFLVWEWRSWDGQKTGPQDTSYVPCGKPAMDVIKKYFQYSDSPRRQEPVAN
ncbi:MAG TPA: glycoside hydrolase TIM-barrel-like domain-containing protein [Phycisphaerae bacterium]|nr:glycoside hydrolase TIM-barrel-like domain-containing protein [Phycisphaerae bacterium]